MFDSLAAECQNDHEHLPFQLHMTSGQWSFDTSAEAAHPTVLTQRVASLVKQFLETKGCVFVPRPFPRINTLAAQHRQHRKRDQLIPEFFAIQWCPTTHKLSPLQKLLPSSSQGDSPEEGVNKQVQPGQQRIGTWHTPEQFVARAKRTKHPMDENALEPITLEAIRTIVTTNPKLVAIERKKNLLKARIKDKQLQKDEDLLHSRLPVSVEKVVKDKKILLWKSLLQECGYDDMEVVDFLIQGVPLVGTHNHPSCYAMKVKPATLTEAELRGSAAFCRRALESRRPQTDEPGFAEHLEETASEEVSLGFLEGPFLATDDVTEALVTLIGESCAGS